jgi:pimeloyl-ACP methyl ester carboxylesterase
MNGDNRHPCAMPTTAAVNGHSISYEEDGTGLPVVFVSGLGDPGSIWSKVLRTMTVPVKTVTYDRAGIGASPPRSGAAVARPYSDFADEIVGLMASVVPFEPAVMVGHSFGCLIIRALASAHPELIAGIVLVDGSVPEMTLWPGSTDYRDGDDPGATMIDATTGQTEILPLTLEVPAVVVTRTPGRWGDSPQATTEVDSHWQLSQRSVAAELGAAHLIAADSGHYVHVDAPTLVALAVDMVVRAARDGRPALASSAEIIEAGGRPA